MNIDTTVFWLILWGVAIVSSMGGYLFRGMARGDILENRIKGLKDRVEELEK